MKQEIIETIHLIADEGKVFIRIESGEIMGKEIYLGYSHYIGGKLLEEPHKDVPEDFEEIDDPSLVEEATEIPEAEVADSSDETEVTESAPEEPSESSAEENEETTQEAEE